MHTKQVNLQGEMLGQIVGSSSILMTVGLFQLPAPWSGTLSRMKTGTRHLVQIVSDVYIKRICLLDISAFRTLEVLDDN